MRHLDRGFGQNEEYPYREKKIPRLKLKINWFGPKTLVEVVCCTDKDRGLKSGPAL